jgi:hypothetical protein
MSNKKVNFHVIIPELDNEIYYLDIKIYTSNK